MERLRSGLGDRYSVDRELGRGGMATVFLATDLKHRRQVAIKVLHPELAAAIGAERFLHEIEIAAGLTHPHILSVHDSGEAAGSIYYVMPYAEGESLRDRLQRERQLTIEDALQITREVADALGYAHARGIVHRDVKPENILLSGGHAYVVDFGIAKAVTISYENRLTPSGFALGTPAYMSPEQASGTGEVDARSDVYSLGCVLYEMLAGEPPFTGPTAQAIGARVQLEEPRSLAVVRAAVPGALEDVVRTALAKVPADRYATTAEFVAALNGAAISRRPAKRRRGLRLALAATALAAVGVAALVWRFVIAPPRALDPQRVLVYPLGSSVADARGEDAATAMVQAVNNTGYLKGDDGWSLLPTEARSDPRALARWTLRRIARRQGAGFYLFWSLVLGDSARVVLELRDVTADSIALRYTLSFGPQVDAWTLGLRTAEAVLPALILPGRPVDLSSLQDRVPAAIASFLQGERSYRRARFREAFRYDSIAIGEDSAFALAALRGAQAASWNERSERARTLIQVALQHRAALPARYVDFAEGLEDYLAAAPDSSVGHFRRALRRDPEWAEAWVALGEVYYHYLPHEAPLDSLAEAAFNEARRRDPGFAPPLYHLLEFALRHDDLRNAEALMGQFRAQSPDSLELAPLELMFRCVRGSPDVEEWRAAALRSPRLVTEAARMLTVGGLRQPRCAEAAWRSMLDQRIDRTYRWGALLGLQGVLVAEGRYDDVRRLLDDSTVYAADAQRQLYLLDLVAGAPVEREAAAAAAQLRAAYRADPKMSSGRIWYLGLFDARRGAAAELHALAESLAARADRTAERSDHLVARSLAAHAALASGDTAAALALLEALEPTAPKSLITWQPWESLGPERLALAELRMARGEYTDALRLASSFDAPASIPLVALLRASLQLRVRVARATGRGNLAVDLERRVAALGGRAAPK